MAYIYKILLTRCGTISQTKVNSSDAMWKVPAVFSFQTEKNEALDSFQGYVLCAPV